MSRRRFTPTTVHDVKHVPGHAPADPTENSWPRVVARISVAENLTREQTRALLEQLQDEACAECGKPTKMCGRFATECAAGFLDRAAQRREAR